MGRLIVPTEAPLLAPETVAYAEQCRVAFGLEEWNIWFCEHDAPGGSTENAGHTDLNTRYLRATITLLRGLRPERRRSVTRHEMLHIALAPIDEKMRYIVAMLPKKERKRAREMYIDAEEQTIERLTRAMESLFPALQKGSE